MPDIKFTDAAAISGTRITGDGYLVADVRCARTGIQQYRAADLGMPGEGLVSVFRPESVVFDKASLATFAGKPVTMGHPAEPVTADNWKALAVGDVGTEIARDGEFVRVPMKLMDASAIAAVQAGTRELSLGYTTGIDFEDGMAPDGTPYQAVQTGPIRINHLAIVPAARGGAQLRIGDGTPDEAAQWGASPFTTDGKEIGMADTILKTVVLGDQAVQVSAADASTAEAFKAASAKALADAKVAHDSAIAAKDKELAAKDAEISALKAKVMDGAALDAIVADRAALIAKAKTIAPTVVTDGKSPAEIRKAAVVAKNGAAMADKSEAYIEAAFDLLADAAATDPAAKALADGAGKSGDKPDAHAAYSKAISDAWKTQPQKGVN